MKCRECGCDESVHGGEGSLVGCVGCFDCRGYEKPKQRHQWRASAIVKNWQYCKLCEVKRRRAKGQYYYEGVGVSKTYCQDAA